MTGAKLSVGPPYFNALFIPLMALLMMVMAVGVIVRWKDTPVKWLVSMLTPVLLGSAALAVVAGVAYGDFNWAVLATFMLAAWVLLAGVRDIFDKTRHKGLIKGLPTLTRSYWGMQVAHLGIAVCALGVVLSSQNSAERDLRLAPGESMDLAGYHFIFEGAKHFEGPNFTSDKGTVRVIRDGKEVSVLHPEKRLYTVQNSVMTEAGIDAGFTRDLYVALGEPLGNGAWAVRVRLADRFRRVAGGAGSALSGQGQKPRARSTGHVGSHCMKRWLMLLPLAIFLVVAVFLYRGLYLDPAELPSAMINKPFPEFSLPAVQGDKTLSRADILGKPALVNVWGTWCISCRVEHPVLNKLAQQGVVIYGINYKDVNADALKWLEEFHNPYQLDIRDDAGSLGLNLGVYGAPETFFIDAKGVIRDKFVGVIDEQVWREKLAAKYQALVDEAKP
jgi:DsbE subfamily thiol:disulfide oxidoreductase